VKNQVADILSWRTLRLCGRSYFPQRRKVRQGKHYRLSVNLLIPLAAKSHKRDFEIFLRFL